MVIRITAPGLNGPLYCSGNALRNGNLAQNRGFGPQSQGICWKIVSFGCGQTKSGAGCQMSMPAVCPVDILRAHVHVP